MLVRVGPRRRHTDPSGWARSTSAFFPGPKPIKRERPVVFAVAYPGERVGIDRVVLAKERADARPSAEIAGIPKKEARHTSGLTLDDRLATEIRACSDVDLSVHVGGSVGRDRGTGGGATIECELNPGVGVRDAVPAHERQWEVVRDLIELVLPLGAANDSVFGLIKTQLSSGHGDD